MSFYKSMFLKSRLVILLLLFEIFCFSKAYSALVSKVVGTVGEKVITSREVQINSIVESALYLGQKKIPLPRHDTLFFDREVNRVLIERVVFYESEVFSKEKISKSELVKARNAVLQKVNAQLPKYWGELSVSEKELESILSKKLKAKNFIAFKTKASIVPVTQSEALKYYAENKSRFGNDSFKQFEEKIKIMLSRKQAQERIHSWFAVLQKKYKVRRTYSSPKAKKSK